MKRFVDTNRYSDPWFGQLSSAAKCVVAYIEAKCDASGVWAPNFRAAAFEIGLVDIDWKGVFTQIAGTGKIPQLEVTADGRWWLTGFVASQFGMLQPGLPTHKNVIKRLEANGLWGRFLELFPVGIAAEIEAKEKAVPATPPRPQPKVYESTAEKLTRIEAIQSEIGNADSPPSDERILQLRNEKKGLEKQIRENDTTPYQP
jgi:hypothetical protein